MGLGLGSACLGIGAGLLVKVDDPRDWGGDARDHAMETGHHLLPQGC